ncbi:hydrogenase maturation protease [Denitrovibrio acetiphilus DSM 12809]|uniref:Hydrogenase maturation protease n=1 Tax=Denitrovibrio acetiphilus (strain DSM 12809 / NBRC 114555 / N2460) TaxID=522772 RepID=D4H4B8_DENA2|nr:hydrogenase maturation protease [Denitrovibrio acetiphilus]ADD69247.1 hydrogenase maturation protease [Denitrovibrio acetiphilus DSM 12809]
MNLLVLGIGNLVMNDDAAGVLVAQELAPKFNNKRDDLLVLDGGTLGLDLLGYIEWADRLVLVDAVELDLKPGTVVKLEGDDIDTAFESKLSAHQMGMKDMLLTAELIGHRPAEIVFYGIQAETVQMDMELSEAVKANMPKLTSHVAAEIEAFMNPPDSL